MCRYKKTNWFLLSCFIHCPNGWYPTSPPPSDQVIPNRLCKTATSEHLAHPITGQPGVGVEDRRGMTHGVNRIFWEKTDGESLALS